MSGGSFPPEWAYTIHEALQKTAEIIVRGRQTPSPPLSSSLSSSSSGSSMTSRRFRLNLDVEEVPVVRQRMAGWRDNLHTPLILDLIFEERDLMTAGGQQHGGGGGGGAVKYRDLLERWYIVFEPISGGMGGSDSSSGSGSGSEGFAMQAQVKRTQKRLSVILRTLYAFLRLNPIYQLVRRLNEIGPHCGAKIEANLNAGLLNALRADMDSLVDGEAFQSYRFADVPTPYGIFRMAVAFRSNSDDFELPQAAVPSPSPLIQPMQIFNDYVAPDEASTSPSPSTAPAQRNSNSRNVISYNSNSSNNSRQQQQQVSSVPRTPELSGLSHALRRYEEQEEAEGEKYDHHHQQQQQHHHHHHQSDRGGAPHPYHVPSQQTFSSSYPDDSPLPPPPPYYHHQQQQRPHSASSSDRGASPSYLVGHSASGTTSRLLRYSHSPPGRPIASSPSPLHHQYHSPYYHQQQQQNVYGTSPSASDVWGINQARQTPSIDCDFSDHPTPPIPVPFTGPSSAPTPSLSTSPFSSAGLSLPRYAPPRSSASSHPHHQQQSSTPYSHPMDIPPQQGHSGRRSSSLGTGSLGSGHSLSTSPGIPTDHLISPHHPSHTSPARGGLSTSSGGGSGGIYGTPPGRSVPLSPHTITSSSSRQQQQQGYPFSSSASSRSPIDHHHHHHQQQQQQQQHPLSRGRSLDSAPTSASPLRYFGRQGSGSRPPSWGGDEHRGDIGVIDEIDGSGGAGGGGLFSRSTDGTISLGTSPSQREGLSFQQLPGTPPGRSHFSQGGGGGVLRPSSRTSPHIASTPPFSMGGGSGSITSRGGSSSGGTTSAAEGGTTTTTTKDRGLPSPFALGQSKLGCSPPFSTQTLNLLSRSPSQPLIFPPPPSPPTFQSSNSGGGGGSSQRPPYGRTHSIDISGNSGIGGSSTSRSLVRSTAGGIGGGSASSLTAAIAGSSSLSLAQPFESLGDSPFKPSLSTLFAQAGRGSGLVGEFPTTPTSALNTYFPSSSSSATAARLGVTTTGEGAVLTTGNTSNRPRSASLSAAASPPSPHGEGLMAMGGLTGSVLALRSLECLEAEEAVQAIRQSVATSSERSSMMMRNRQIGGEGFAPTSPATAAEDEDLPFAPASSMVQLSHSSASAFGGERSYHHQSGGSESFLNPSSQISASMTSAESKAAAARLAEQCLTAPPLQMFASLSIGRGGASSGNTTTMGELRMMAATATNATGIGGGQEASMGGGGGDGGDPLISASTSSLARSVKSLGDELRTFQKFQRELSSAKSSTASAAISSIAGTLHHQGASPPSVSLPPSYNSTSCMSSRQQQQQQQQQSPSSSPNDSRRQSPPPPPSASS